MSTKLGLSGVVYCGTPGVARASWATSPNAYGIYSGAASTALASPPVLPLLAARNVTVNWGGDEADLSARASQIALGALGLAKLEVDIECPYDPADVVTQMVMDAYFGRTTIAVAIMDASVATGVYGTWMDAAVMESNFDQPLSKEDTVKFKLKPGMAPGSTYTTLVPPQRVICT